MLAESYEWIEWIKQGDDAEKVKGMGKEKGTGNFANHVEKTAGKEEAANMYEYRYEEVNQKGKKTEHRFQWITNIDLTKRNLEEMVCAGRGRWKIENEEFNNQKNGIYDIEHLNSNGMKNHYLLTQIADIMMQLYAAWNPLIREIGQSKKIHLQGYWKVFEDKQ